MEFVSCGQYLNAFGDQEPFRERVPGPPKAFGYSFF
jgi:hypothetical protein